MLEFTHKFRTQAVEGIYIGDASVANEVTVVIQSMDGKTPLMTCDVIGDAALGGTCAKGEGGVPLPMVQARNETLVLLARASVAAGSTTSSPDEAQQRE